MRRPAGRLATPALSVLLVLGTMAGAPAAASSPRDDHPAVELPRAVHGAAAVRLLADQLDAAAARNEMSPSDLTDLLTTDPSAWVDTSGAVFFKDGVAVAPAADPVSAQAPLAETLQLHSKPASSKTIFLDFDGGTVTATRWNVDHAGIPDTQPAWDPSGNGATFTDSELTAIQTIWQAVAEDYAPFDVDVTTADPGPAGIVRSSALDLSYGSHVLITPSVGAQSAICPSGCGGVAYLNVFDVARGAGGDGYGYLQPAWVFPHQLGNSPKNIAEAAAHEVGHNFGLSHDGNATQGYDRGHGAWAPIMGVGYDHPISQWSKGDYPGATQHEDDVSIIGAVAGMRLDEAPTTILLAPPIPTGTSYVTSRADVDTYLLGTCNGSASVVAKPLASLADLDIELTLRDSLGRAVATDAPASGQTSPSVASGMAASLTRSLPRGTYYVSVDGAGNGDWSNGYDDYGSLGAYTLSATGCDGVVGPVVTTRSTTTGLTATPSGRDVTLAVEVTADGGTPAGTVELRDGGTLIGNPDLSAGTASLTLTSVAPGDHVYLATFVPTDAAAYAGSSSPVRTVTLPAPGTPTPTPTVDPAPAPSVVASTTAVRAPAKAKAGTRPTVTVTVRRGAAAAGGAVVITVGKKSTTLTLEAGAAKLRLPRLRTGRLRIRVRYLGDATTSGSVARKTVRVV